MAHPFIEDIDLLTIGLLPSPTAHSVAHALCLTTTHRDVASAWQCSCEPKVQGPARSASQVSRKLARNDRSGAEATELHAVMSIGEPPCLHHPILGILKLTVPRGLRGAAEFLNPTITNSPAPSGAYSCAANTKSQTRNVQSLSASWHSAGEPTILGEAQYTARSLPSAEVTALADDRTARVVGDGEWER